MFSSFKAGPQTKRHLVPAVFAVAFSVLVVPIWASRRPPVEFLGFRLKEATVVQGEKLGLVYGYKVNWPCTAEIYLTMYDQTEAVRQYGGSLSESIESPQDAGPDVFTGITKYIGVPIHAAPGTGQLEGVTEFRCNILHRWWPIYVRIPPQEFTIVKKPPEAVPEQNKNKLQDLLLPPIPEEILRPPFRSVPTPIPIPAPGGGGYIIPTPTPKNIKQVRRRTKDVKTNTNTKVVNKTTQAAAPLPPPIQPAPVQASTEEELPNWIKWLLKH